ncbi:hypothetical protein K7432_006582 [Basidiobolus ranarum]|uniref:Uncharacterized protein n=1 Tax=Basidiobolus ranarum TaxID=34480 RepID=A0ABR2W1F5_9FUNG
MSEVYSTNFKLKCEPNTIKPSSMEQPSFQMPLTLRPNACVICLTCLTCAGKYGSDDCHCPASDIHWNKKRLGYKVEFRRRSILPSNQVFMTWFRANLSQRLIWDETCKEVKLCMSCNSTCWRWAKVFKKSNLANELTPGSNGLRTARFSPLRSISTFSSRKDSAQRTQDCTDFFAGSSVLSLRNSKPRLSTSIRSCPDQFTAGENQNFSPISVHKSLPLDMDTLMMTPTRSTPPAFSESDSVSQSSSPSPRLQTPPNGESTFLVTYDLAQLTASASPKGKTPLKTVTLRMTKKIVKDRIVVSPKMTFNHLIRHAIQSNLPEGKRYVIKSMDGQYEYVPDDFVSETFYGQEHVDLSLDDEAVPSISLDDFDMC